ncbi:MAG: hypothetical protein H7070_11990 [Saprospiraceae bacterium]|nr:hypothetical protein [Pyrinomonadaceae bacterium]
MKVLRFKPLAAAAVIIFAASFASAQKSRPKAKPVQPQKSIIFAVISDGKTLEPIAFVDKGKLSSTDTSGVEANVTAAFTKTYYKPKGTYNLIFGGVNSGTVTVVTSDPTAECTSNMANVTTTAPKAKLKGLVMGLATNVKVTTGTSYRRLPTPAERTEIEGLVRAEFTKQKVDGRLDYHNLTAIDVDRDGMAELVGSFFIKTGPKSRALLFFIADKGADGKYSFGFNEFDKMDESSMMSGADIEAVDTGVYNELLLDSLELDGDKVNEIFTYVKSLEGAGFNVYKREGGKWIRSFEGSNYHCAF